MSLTQAKYLSVSRGKLMLAAFLLIVTISCSSDKAIDPQVEATPPYKVHVAFAGGGWRAHTGHSAWTISLLANGNKTLAQVFTNVETFGSNSGGSWFNTMLNYSKKFVSAIEAKNAIHTWGSSSKTATGWLGQQQYLFDNAGCSILSGDAYLACVFDTYTGSITNATYWKDVIEDLVFNNSDISGPLSGTRQSWAANKSLLLAATMLTTEAVLEGTDFGDKQYYQACLSPAVPKLNGYNGASCSIASKQVTPVTFSSIPSGSNLTVPPFLPAAGSNGSGHHFNLGYTENAKHVFPIETAKLENPLANAHVPVQIAAAASSAAAGFAASLPVTGDWQESYAGSDEALNFQLEGKMKYQLASGMSVKDLAKSKIVQIADGGPMDNSGVAQIVKFLQLNNQSDGFNIVAFDNVQSLFKPAGNGAKIGVDLANLFGEGLASGNRFCTKPNGKGYCVAVPELKIFDPSSLNTTSESWSITSNTNNPPSVVQELVYTKYQVTTVANSSFGIVGGSKGTLHAFTAAWSGAGTAPENSPAGADFKAYNDMLAFINIGLHSKDKNGNTGIKFLQDALGI